MRRIFLVLGIGLGLMAGCTPPQHKDILVIGISQTVSTLDPAMHRDRVVETVIRNMFDGLVTRTPDMRFKHPLLFFYFQLFSLRINNLKRFCLSMISYDFT